VEGQQPRQRCRECLHSHHQQPEEAIDRHRSEPPVDPTHQRALDSGASVVVRPLRPDFGHSPPLLYLPSSVQAEIFDDYADWRSNITQDHQYDTIKHFYVLMGAEVVGTFALSPFLSTSLTMRFSARSILVLRLCRISLRLDASHSRRRGHPDLQAPFDCLHPQPAPFDQHRARTRQGLSREHLPSFSLSSG
jgi:hypothetical protein